MVISVNNKTKYFGFTLIELLVVIAIIAILATALTPQLTKAREHGYASRCKMNLHHLAQAALSYSVENESYLPHAGPFEYFKEYESRYYEAKGWVNWLPKSTPPRWPTNTSQRSKMQMPTWYGSNAVNAIKAGTLFEYMGEDLSAYICPKFKKKEICGHKEAMRSYSMNRFFGCEDGHAWQRMLNLGKDSSRLLMFSEMCPSQKYPKKPFPNVSKRWINPSKDNVEAGDSVLDWRGPQGSSVSATEPFESIGYIHPMSGEYYAHVVFVDGHVEAFTVLRNSSGGMTNNITATLGQGEY